MKYEGPLPDEELPVGEEPLLPEELARVAVAMFEIDEVGLKHFPDRITEAEVTPQRWAATQGAKTQFQGEAFETLKESVIEQRD